MLLLIAAVGELLLQRLFPVGLQPDLLLIVVLYVGWNSYAFKGGLTGSLFGLVSDNLLGTYFGINGLSKTLLGFLASYLSRWIAAESRLIRPGLIMLLAFVDKMIVTAMLAVLGQSISSVLWFTALSEALVTGALGEGFFRLYNRVKSPPKNFRRLAS